MGIAYNSKIVTDGLMLCLDAANAKSYPGSGATWTDLSGNGNNGTLTNGPTFSSDNKGSIVFDGIDDKIDCGNTNTSVNGLTALSGIVWFKKTTNTTPAPRLISKRSALQDTGFWNFNSSVDTHTIAFEFDFVTTDIGRRSTESIPLNEWAMASFTWTGSDLATSIKLYINGQETTYSSSVDGVGGRVTETTNSLVVGNADWANRPLGGNIAMALLYNRALTAAEIQQNFNALRGRLGI